MKILVVGGTVFLGRHIVEHARGCGHEVTLFNRGKSRPGKFQELEHIVGDRDGDLKSLANREWDAVIDTCGYFPRIVKKSAEFLSNVVGHYTFISSVSVYETEGLDTVSEQGKLRVLESPEAEVMTGETYGGLKVLCEQVVQEIYGVCGLVIRPGLIVGPHDISDRFTYWPHRFRRGGDVLVPDRLNQPIQIIDVRDLARWTVSMVERQVGGSFNATAPQGAYSLGGLLERVRDHVNLEAQLVPVSGSFLDEQEVTPWKDIPLYLGVDPSDDAAMNADISKAIEYGFQMRALEETIDDTLAWSITRSDEYVWRAGLEQSHEEKLLLDYRKPF